MDDRHAWLFSALLGATPGCSAEEECDTGDGSCNASEEINTFTDEPSVHALTASCCQPNSGSYCSDGPLFWVDLFTIGQISAATVRVEKRHTEWNEEHAIPVIDEDQEGFWQDRYLQLSVADTQGCTDLADCASLYVSGETTLFSCSGVDELTWAIELYEPDDVSLGCLTWGLDTSLFPECETWSYAD